MSKIFSKLTDDCNLLIHQNVTSTYINPYQYLILRNRDDLIKNLDYVFFDGMVLPLVLKIFTRLRYGSIPPDMSGFYGDLFKKMEAEESKTFFVGGDEKVISGFIRVLKENFRGIPIVGYRNGYFNNEEEIEKCLLEICYLNPSYVILGMGAPHQEEFMVRLKLKGFRGCTLTCGGFFRQTTKSISYYPLFFEKSNLRWVYRIIDEPRLLKRYLIIYPVGILKFIFDLFHLCPKNRKI